MTERKYQQVIDGNEWMDLVGILEANGYMIGLNKVNTAGVVFSIDDPETGEIGTYNTHHRLLIADQPLDDLLQIGNLESFMTLKLEEYVFEKPTHGDINHIVVTRIIEGGNDADESHVIDGQFEAKVGNEWKLYKAACVKYLRDHSRL
jgi:hypothetical protein